MPHALCVIIASFYDGVNTSCVYILCRRIAIKDLGEGRVDDLHRGIFASSNFLSDYTRLCKVSMQVYSNHFSTWVRGPVKNVLADFAC